LGLARVIVTLADVVTILILVDVLASWIPSLNESWLVGMVRRLTNPILEPFRRLIPPRALGGIDVSPIAAILALRFLIGILI